MMSDPLAIAAFLRTHRATVLTAFVEEMTSRSRALDRLPQPVLLDHLPAFLEEMAAQLEARVSAPPGPPPEASTLHGVQRLALGYDIKAVILEYEVLRSALVVQATRAGLTLDLGDLELIAALFSRAVAQAVEAYVAERDQQTAAQQAELDLLVRAGEELTASLDSAETMTRLGGLLVPALADWCVIQLVGDRREDARVAHVNPARLVDTRRVAAASPLAADPSSSDLVVLTGEPQLVASVEDGAAVSSLDAGYVSELRRLETRSWISIPLRGLGPELGVITVGTSESGRVYASKDLRIALELARRAGSALENARLFELSQRERERAEALARAKDEFIMLLSHELRSPINAIVSWTGLLQTDALPESRRGHALEVIARNAAAQTQLVSDLLEIHEVSTGKIRLDRTRVDLAMVIDLVVEEFRIAMEGKRIDLTVDLDRAHAVVFGDLDRLRQIVWNLVSNAIKFTPKGGAVELVLRRVSTDLELVVRDTGAGIPAEFLARMFDPFAQSDMSTSRPHGGLGLGLAITQHLVVLHGGAIHAESAGPGKGVAITVRLPVA